MVRFNKPIGIFLLAACTVPCYGDTVLSSAETHFSATIVDGSCDWTLDNAAIQFPVVTPGQIKPGATLAILPLNASIQCNQPGLTPRLSISGNTPYADNRAVFLDGAQGNGLGFMLQFDEGQQQAPALSNFYGEGMAGKALSDGNAISAPALHETLQQTQQIIWVGLVGMSQGESVKPGPFSSVITLTGLIP